MPVLTAAANPGAAAWADYVLIDGSTATVAPEGAIVYNTADGKLYRQTTAPQGNTYTALTGSSSVLTTPAKQPCRVATAINVLLAGGSSPSTVDGITAVQGTRILVWNQALASENGIYEVTTFGAGGTSTWTRAADFDDSVGDHLEAGVSVYVQEGNSYSRTTFTLVTTGALTIGTTPLEFIPMGGLARTDATSTEVIVASTAFANGTFVWSSPVAMRDHTDLAIYFNPQTLGGNTSVDIVVAWSDDGATIPLADGDNYQATDFNITGFTDGSFNPKPYTARLTTAGGELVAGAMAHLTVPKGGGVCRIGVKGNSATGTFQVRTQRLVR